MDTDVIIVVIQGITLIILGIIAMKIIEFIMIYRLKQSVITQMKELEFDSSMMTEFFKNWEW